MTNERFDFLPLHHYSRITFNQSDMTPMSCYRGMHDIYLHIILFVYDLYFTRLDAHRTCLRQFIQKKNENIPAIRFIVNIENGDFVGVQEIYASVYVHCICYNMGAILFKSVL